MSDELEGRRLRAALEETQARLRDALERVEKLENRQRAAGETEQGLRAAMKRLESERDALQTQLGGTGGIDAPLLAVQSSLNSLSAKLSALELGLPATAAQGKSCRRCGSTELVRRAETEAGDGPLTVYVGDSPNTFSRSHTSAALLARVCGRCGHVELFTERERAATLYEAS